MIREFFRLWLRSFEYIHWKLETIGCECHWIEPYGPVIMADCVDHD